MSLCSSIYDLSHLTSGVDFVIHTLTIIRRLRSRPQARQARRRSSFRHLQARPVRNRQGSVDSRIRLRREGEHRHQAYRRLPGLIRPDARPRPRPARTSRPLRVQQDDEEERAPARPPRRRHVRGIGERIQLPLPQMRQSTHGDSPSTHGDSPSLGSFHVRIAVVRAPLFLTMRSAVGGASRRLFSFKLSQWHRPPDGGRLRRI